MYIVKLHNFGEPTTIHDSKEKLTSGKVTKGINAIDSFQFTILPSNAGFEEIYDYTTLVSVYNTNQNRTDFYGRVLYSEDSMGTDGMIQKDVICESYLGFLCDSQQEYVAEQNWTVNGLLQHIINIHNSQVENFKHFTIGEVTVTDPNDNVYIGIQRENTWETIKKKLIDTLGGEIRFRVVGDTIYLDYLDEIGELSQTEITLSKNMNSISREKDPSEIVTRLIPLGAKLTVTDSDGNEKETEERLDITSVNGGINYIDNEAAIALFGIRVGTVEFDDVTVASILYQRGVNWLADNNKIQVGYKVSALDLSLIGLETDDFDVCNKYVVKNPLLGINETLRVIKKSIDICEEVNSTLEFGDKFESLTESIKRQNEAVQKISNTYVTNETLEETIDETISKTTTLIEQTETQIRLEVSTTYLTKAEGAEIEEVTESKIEQSADSILLSVSNTYTTKGEFEDQVTETAAQLELKVGRDENDQIISMINASADRINLTADRITITDEKFSLANGEIQTTSSLYQDGYDYTRTTTLNEFGLRNNSVETFAANSAYSFYEAIGFQEGYLYKDVSEINYDTVELMRVLVNGNSSYRILLDTTDNTIKVHAMG